MAEVTDYSEGLNRLECDQFVLFVGLRAGYLPQGVPLQLIGYLPEETSFLPWHAASRALYQLDKLLDRTDEYSLFSVNTQSINYYLNQSFSQSISQSVTAPC